MPFGPGQAMKRLRSLRMEVKEAAGSDANLSWTNWLEIALRAVTKQNLQMAVIELGEKYGWKSVGNEEGDVFPVPEWIHITTLDEDKDENKDEDEDSQLGLVLNSPVKCSEVIKLAALRSPVGPPKYTTRGSGGPPRVRKLRWHRADPGFSDRSSKCARGDSDDSPSGTRRTPRSAYPFFRAFSMALKQIFQEITPGREAAQRLVNIRQGGRTTAKYAIEFRTLAAEAGWDATALGDVFIRGLSRRVKDCLVARDLPSDLNALIALAIQIDRRLGSSEREHRGEGGARESHRGRTEISTRGQCFADGAPTSQSSGTQPPPEEPMQLGRARLTESEKRRRRSQGLCLYCGQHGHFASKCPLKDLAHHEHGGSSSTHSLQQAVLIDSGADASLMDARLVERMGVAISPLAAPVETTALDGHKLWKVTHHTEAVTMEFADGHTERIHFLVVESPRLCHKPTARFQPPKGRLFQLAPAERQAMREYLDSALATSIIRPSSSPAGAGFFFMGKKDGTLRSCIDYRGLNDITIRDSYPLPLLHSAFELRSGAKWFTKLDLRNAYHLVRIREGDEWKTAFNTPNGHYEYLVMPFGLTNAPAVFQSFVNEVLGPMINRFAFVYLDDILIFSSTEEEHKSHVRQVLKKLLEHRLFVKAEKCEFHVSTVSFLGFIVSQGRIQMDPAKTKAVEDWPTPQCRRDVQRFLGFANFYRRFIRRFSSIVAPLHRLTSPKAPFQWSEEADSAFQHLKRSFTTAPVLRMPDPECQFVVEVDASDSGVGAVLSQRDPAGGRLHPCAFMSRKLSPAERNYDIRNRELLAVKTALEEWRHWLEGTAQPFLVYTDHKNLEYIKTAKRLNSRQARWALFFSRFHFHLSYRPGSKNTKPDALSRLHDHLDSPVEPDHRPVV
ncbi:uncharacterized protein LOC129604791 [Betta splendens]|uniref:Uncharacterized protein LOC129604791 n=1 Tax=Betta splendens TaxID=158456 RepID=A0A9W2Y3N7_BETSP|nr:uncharacterized protein LOC129604791 [Betta splendens]